MCGASYNGTLCEQRVPLYFFSPTNWRDGRISQEIGRKSALFRQSQARQTNKYVNIIEYYKETDEYIQFLMQKSSENACIFLKCVLK